MHHAIQNFGTLVAERKSVILGDMLELGEASSDFHRKVLADLASLSGLVVQGQFIVRQRRAQGGFQLTAGIGLFRHGCMKVIEPIFAGSLGASIGQ